MCPRLDPAAQGKWARPSPDPAMWGGRGMAHPDPPMQAKGAWSRLNPALQGVRAWPSPDPNCAPWGEGHVAWPQAGYVGVKCMGIWQEGSSGSITSTTPLLSNFPNHGEPCRPNALVPQASFGPQTRG